MICTDKLCFSYGKKEILKDLDLVFKTGELCAVIGENGSGKTTLLRLLAGLSKESSGSVTLDGLKSFEYSRKEFARLVSYFPQGRHTPSVSAYELISYARNPYKSSNADKLAVEKAMLMTDTEIFAERDLKSLSYGERQRVYLAMLIAQDTPYMLLDEPTNFLDAKNKFALMDILTRLKDEGKGIITVLHDIPIALRYFDRIVALDSGRVAFDSSKDDFIKSKVSEKIFGISCSEIASKDGKEYVVSPLK